MFVQAISWRNSALNPGKPFVSGRRVLEIGTGPMCLLSFNAAFSGASSVLAVEASLPSYERAKRLVKVLGADETIHVVYGHSKAIPGEAFRMKKPEVVIHEILGDFASQEGKEGGAAVALLSTSRRKDSSFFFWPGALRERAYRQAQSPPFITVAEATQRLCVCTRLVRHESSSSSSPIHIALPFVDAARPLSPLLSCTSSSLHFTTTSGKLRLYRSSSLSSAFSVPLPAAHEETSCSVCLSGVSSEHSSVSFVLLTGVFLSRHGSCRIRILLIPDVASFLLSLTPDRLFSYGAKGKLYTLLRWQEDFLGRVALKS